MNTEDRIILFTVGGGPENGGWKGEIHSCRLSPHNYFHGEIYLYCSEEHKTLLEQNYAATEAEVVTFLTHILEERVRELQELAVTIDMASSLCPNLTAKAYLDQASREISAGDAKKAKQKLLKALLTDTSFVLPNADQTLTFRFRYGTVEFKIPNIPGLIHSISTNSIHWGSPITDMIQEVLSSSSAPVCTSWGYQQFILTTELITPHEVVITIHRE